MSHKKSLTANLPAQPSSLMRLAAKILDSLQLNYLREQGFYKDLTNYSYVFQYPPPVTLEPIEETIVWSDLSPDAYSGSLRQIGLYVHIPFCTGTCSFCYFARYPLHQPPVSIDNYINLLKREISLYVNLLSLGSHQITSLAFGGGTPTCLDEEQTTEILEYIRSHLNMLENIEMSFESSPETILGKKNRHKLQTLFDLQVNRLSIGIQTFEDDLLMKLSRRHNASMGKEALIAARQAGFQNINLDIIYGLPEQSLHHWENTLNNITHLRPESVSLYRLRVHPKGSLSKISQSSFPSETLSLLMYIMAVEHLREAGYLHVASHNFVLAEKYIQKHVTEKQGSEHFELLGTGVSAYSYLNHYHYWNTNSLIEYQKQVEAAKLPIWIGSELSLEEQMRKVMVLGMHEYRGVNKVAFKKRFGIMPIEVFRTSLDTLTQLGLLSDNGDCISPTYTGMIFADEICPHFYSKETQERIRAIGSHRYGINYIGDKNLTVDQ